jgi:hypothetical protein
MEELDHDGDSNQLTDRISELIAVSRFGNSTSCDLTIFFENGLQFCSH